MKKMKSSFKVLLAVVAVFSAPAFARGPVVGGISLDMTPKQIRAAVFSQGRSLGETRSTTMYSHEVGSVSILVEDTPTFDEGGTRDSISYTKDWSLLRYEKVVYFRSDRPLDEIAKPMTEKLGDPYYSGPYSGGNKTSGSTFIPAYKGYALEWAAKVGGEAIAPRELGYDSCARTTYKFGAICDWHFSVSISRKDGGNLVQVKYTLIDAANEYLLHKNAARRNGIGSGAKEFDPASQLN